MTDEDRRMTDPAPWSDTARILAVMYTFGFFVFVLALMFREVPVANKEAMLVLLGIMSMAQSGIIKHFFDGSRAADVAQRSTIVSKDKADEVIAEIAKAAPVPAILPATPVVTPAPATADGIVPAAEVAQPKGPAT